MAKIYYDPDKDELIPRPQQVKPSREKLIQEGSGLYYLCKCLMMIVLTAAFLALEALLIYEWWMHIELIVLWFILIAAVGILYTTLMILIINPDYIII